MDGPSLARFACVRATGAAGVALMIERPPGRGAPSPAPEVLRRGDPADFGNRVIGSVDHARNGFDPHKMLTDWDVGQVSIENGRKVREWTITASDIEIEVAPGVFFPAWAYNRRVPGPTLRCTEGERLRIQFSNGSSPFAHHPFHCIHAARMAHSGSRAVLPASPSLRFLRDSFGVPLSLHSLPLSGTSTRALRLRITTPIRASSARAEAPRSPLGSPPPAFSEIVSYERLRHQLRRRDEF